MVENYRKFITVSLLAFAGVIGFLTSVFFGFLGAHIVVVEKLRSQELFASGIPVLVSAGLFIALQFNKKVVDFLEGVILELQKVVWPSGKDTVRMTIVVVITLIISGIIVGLFDTFWAFTINRLVR